MIVVLWLEKSFRTKFGPNLDLSPNYFCLQIHFLDCYASEFLHFAYYDTGCPKKKCTKLWNKMKWRYVCQSTNPFHRVFSMYNYVFGQIFSPNESFEGVQPIDFRRDPLLKTRKNCPDLTSKYINSEWKLKVCSVKKLIDCIQNPTTQITTTRIY